MLPAWGVALGALALVVLLYALQHLKARQRVVRLPAALLWLQASREAPLRVFRERFRRWLAYLLILAIALLLWFAGARPEMRVAATDRQHFFYLDASAALVGGERFADARRALIADVRAIPAERREVYLGDGAGTRLLAPGENVSLLARRLDGVSASARPSDFGRWARAKVATAAKRPTTLHYYGAWPAAKAVKFDGQDDTKLAFGFLARPTPDNRGIVNLGATPARSGDWSRADVQVEAIAVNGRPIKAADLAFTREGRGFAPQVSDLGAGRFRLDGVEADGRTLGVALRAGDGFAADDRASIRLPDRRRVRIALSPSTPASLRSVVGLDTAFEVVPVERAEIVVRRAGERLGGDKPALVLTAPEGAAFVFTHPDDGAPTDLSEGLGQLGLEQVDAASLADRLDRSISVEVASGPRRSVAVWAALFDQDAAFAKSSGLPLFASKALRWLADRDPWIPYAQAGGDLADQSALYGLGQDRRIAERALNGEIRLGAAGVQRIGGLPVAVSLVDRGQTLAVAEAPPQAVARDAGRRGPPGLIFVLLVMLAGGLLVVEWRAFQRGVMA